MNQKTTMSKRPIVLAAMALAGAVLAVAGAGAVAAQPAADPARGKTVFARCAACHDLNTGAVRLGPSLKGVIGRKSGTAGTFAYSEAMKSKGVVWNAETLDTYLASPSKYIPGNRMAFPPMSNAQDRADVIAYLQQAAR
ncbi:cytochrome c family protein [Novosphingobium sp. SL115]|uniref:c-type cytochrome n=1 Tax=Novosphingobium sp. SL115 TaxID=2995150 RepID=UPI00227534F8|nr:cytochrome c family protein [Novosphingobium sp. SL115]MCY1671920.1 cytochrome c family protein [Novosphingobium sp. SL115]